MRKHDFQTLKATYADLLAEIQSDVTPSGWRDLIFEAIGALKLIRSKTPTCPFRVVALKEKFGELRIYIEFDQPVTPQSMEMSCVTAVVERVRLESLSICQHCGSPGARLIHDMFGTRTVCLAHASVIGPGYQSPRVLALREKFRNRE